MKEIIQENKKNIKEAQKRIKLINIEDLAENLYNASVGNFMWRGKESSKNSFEYPFYIRNIGTHASYEMIVPNVHEVYNFSNDKIKKKMIDSVAWIVDHFGEKIRVDWDYKLDKQGFEQIWRFPLSNLLYSFSGQNSYPLELHEFEKDYLITENSPEMRKYIKDRIGNSLINKAKEKEEFKQILYLTDPLEILPLEIWQKGIQEGFGPQILRNKTCSKTFFGEKKYSIGINEFISQGLTYEQMNNFWQKCNFFSKKCLEKYLSLAEEIKDKSLKKSFINCLNQILLKDEDYVRKGKEILEKK